MVITARAKQTMTVRRIQPIQLEAALKDNEKLRDRSRAGKMLVGSSMMVEIGTRTLFEVIYEDADMLVVNKPAGLVCHPTKTDEYSSLISRVRLYLGKGSNPQLVNR